MMQMVNVAVFSDIHSNFHAFQACYEDALAHGADGFIFLGDYISDLAEPEKTMDLVYEICAKYPTVCLSGNRERYMLECHKGSLTFVPGSKSGSLLFTYQHLRPIDFTFFEGLKKSDTVIINGIPMEIAHADMDDDRFYFEGDAPQTGTIFQKMQCRYLLTGHSHKQYIRNQAGKTIINPGSVGIPQGGSLWPKYAMLQIRDGTVSCDFREVHYDLADVIHSQFQSGLVDTAKYWAVGILYDIITGKECVLALLKQVVQAGNVHDEAVWHSVALQLGMATTEDEIINYYLNQEYLQTNTTNQAHKGGLLCPKP